MTTTVTLTVNLPDEQLAQLQAKAAELGVSLEEFIQLNLEKLLNHSREPLTETLAYIIQGKPAGLPNSGQ